MPRKARRKSSASFYHVIMRGAVLASFLLAYRLQVISHSVNATDFMSGATIRFVVTHSRNTNFKVENQLFF